MPTDDGIRFLTGYDYTPRCGWIGEVLDRYAIRPAMGWATAWSRTASPRPAGVCGAHRTGSPARRGWLASVAGS
ncbi:MAG: hypothetical protein WA880_03665 [Ornithinimicrobium sp.]